MRRRYLFPAVLLGASAVWSIVGAFASTPAQSFDYLDALVVAENYALGTRWIETKIPHSEKLSDQDERLFLQILESYDAPVQTTNSRPFFVDQAKSQLEKRKCRQLKEPCPVNIRLNRTLEPTFIHGDLRLIQLRETSVVQRLSIADDELQFGSKSEQIRQLRYFLTERGWVIKSAEKISEKPVKFNPISDFKAKKLSGLNYYPRSAPWDTFWPDFPIAEIEGDLNTIKTMGANAVRIFVQHEYFSNLDTQADGLSKLRQFLDLCESRQIKVIVTLFDLRADYRVQNWGRDSVHVTTILEAIHDHPSLFAIDLKNQPDLDFEGSGEKHVQAWLEAMISSVRQDYPNTPLTIGWSDPELGARLSGKLDLISFHDYNDPKGLSSRLQSVRQQVGNKPVFITEIGHSRWSVLGEQIDSQSERLHAQLNQITDADGVFIWTLNDFDEIGSNVVGHRPWRKAQQKTFGITKAEGEWLPSAHVFRNFNQTFHSNNIGD